MSCNTLSPIKRIINLSLYHHEVLSNYVVRFDFDWLHKVTKAKCLEKSKQKFWCVIQNIFEITIRN